MSMECLNEKLISYQGKKKKIEYALKCWRCKTVFLCFLQSPVNTKVAIFICQCLSVTCFTPRMDAMSSLMRSFPGSWWFLNTSHFRREHSDQWQCLRTSYDIIWCWSREVRRGKKNKKNRKKVWPRIPPLTYFHPRSFWGLHVSPRGL